MERDRGLAFDEHWLYEYASGLTETLAESQMTQYYLYNPLDITHNALFHTVCKAFIRRAGSHFVSSPRFVFYASK